MTVIIAPLTILVVLVVSATASVTCDTPCWTEGKHADIPAGEFHEILINDIPTSTDEWERSELVACTKSCGAVSTDGYIEVVLTLIREVSLSIDAHVTPLIIACTCGIKERYYCRISNTSRYVPHTSVLSAGCTACNFPSDEGTCRPVFIIEFRIEGKVVASVEFQALVLRVAHLITLVGLITTESQVVVSTPNPVHISQFCRYELVTGGVVDIEPNVTFIIKFMAITILAEEFILQRELRCQIILMLFIPSLVGTCHRVTVDENITQLPTGLAISIVVTQAIGRITYITFCLVVTCNHHSHWEHIEIFTSIIYRTSGIINCHLIYAHVRHSVVGAAQDIVTVVLMVIGK